MLTHAITALLCAQVVVDAAAIGGGAQARPRQAAKSYALPSTDADFEARSVQLALKRNGWQYGPSIAGNTAFYPAGVLGSAAALADKEVVFTFLDAHSANTQLDAKEATAAITAAGGLTSFEDYATKLYDGLWPRTVPEGPYEGMLANYKDDLLFSMERLSTAPFSVRRVGARESLPFTVDNAASITGLTLEELHSQGRLFLVDHSDQADLPRSSEIKYGAACQAYFYIHPDPSNGAFLPLAIKPNNNGSDLVYTPEDQENDWTLAKLMFNMNDIWFTQWYHLAATHVTSEIVYFAAIRTLSEAHPLMSLLHRVNYRTWAMRHLAAERLIFSGGPVDRLFPWAGSIAGGYTDRLYQSGFASNFRANYFERNLEGRGLINSRFGPELRSFPFYDDASHIMREIRSFMDTTIRSYYRTPGAVREDRELQAWIEEAGPAKIKDFPAGPVDNVEVVIDIMTHIAYLVSVQHGTLNTNSPVASTASLPLHPLALYAPLPTEKGVPDLLPFMPPLAAAIGQITLLASFNRPQFKGSDETITHMFDNAELLGRMTPETRDAEQTFREAMMAFSAEVSARKFDANGLSQGMPFVWNALDPNRASYWLTI
jgi:arachidonate 15-lipoxygenase (second type)/8-lipoxygenase (S-type)